MTRAPTDHEEAALAVGSARRGRRQGSVDVEALARAALSEIVDSALSVEEAAKRLGVSPSRVRQRLAERTLQGIKHGGAWRLPEFQFAKRGLVPGIEVVLKALAVGVSAVAVARWFATPNPDLCTRDEDEQPLTPLGWLADGNPPQLAAALAAAL